MNLLLLCCNRTRAQLASQSPQFYLLCHQSLVKSCHTLVFSRTSINWSCCKLGPPASWFVLPNCLSGIRTQLLAFKAFSIREQVISKFFQLHQFSIVVTQFAIRIRQASTSKYGEHMSHQKKLWVKFSARLKDLFHACL